MPNTQNLFTTEDLVKIIRLRQWLPIPCSANNMITHIETKGLTGNQVRIVTNNSVKTLGTLKLDLEPISIALTSPDWGSTKFLLPL